MEDMEKITNDLESLEKDRLEINELMKTEKDSQIINEMKSDLEKIQKEIDEKTMKFQELKKDENSLNKDGKEEDEYEEIEKTVEVSVGIFPSDTVPSQYYDNDKYVIRMVDDGATDGPGTADNVYNEVEVFEIEKVVEKVRKQNPSKEGSKENDDGKNPPKEGSKENDNVKNPPEENSKKRYPGTEPLQNPIDGYDIEKDNLPIEKKFSWIANIIEMIKNSRVGKFIGRRLSKIKNFLKSEPAEFEEEYEADKQARQVEKEAKAKAKAERKAKRKAEKESKNNNVSKYTKLLENASEIAAEKVNGTEQINEKEADVVVNPEEIKEIMNNEKNKEKNNPWKIGLEDLKPLKENNFEVIDNDKAKDGDEK